MFIQCYFPGFQKFFIMYCHHRRVPKAFNQAENIFAILPKSRFHMVGDSFVAVVIRIHFAIVTFNEYFKIILVFFTWFVHIVFLFTCLERRKYQIFLRIPNHSEKDHFIKYQRIILWKASLRIITYHLSGLPIPISKEWFIKLIILSQPLSSIFFELHDKGTEGEPVVLSESSLYKKFSIPHYLCLFNNFHILTKCFTDLFDSHFFYYFLNFF